MIPVTVKGKHNPNDRRAKNMGNLGGALIKSRNKAKLAFKKRVNDNKADIKILNSKEKLESTTHMSDLTEFIYKAGLEERNFAGQKMSRILIEENKQTKIINIKGAPSWDLNSYPESSVTYIDNEMSEKKINVNMKFMKIPRKPDWFQKSSEIQKKDETNSFLNWRAKLAELDDKLRGSLTPYEKNLEVWRQLWFVVDRSDILVQVVDARDPEFFRCDDLVKYVQEKGIQEVKRKRILKSIMVEQKETDQAKDVKDAEKEEEAEAEPVFEEIALIDKTNVNLMKNQLNQSISTKANFLVINKADLIPEGVRKIWSEFLKTKFVDHVFFSAKEEQEKIIEFEEKQQEEEKRLLLEKNQIWEMLTDQHLKSESKQGALANNVLTDIQIETQLDEAKKESSELENKPKEIDVVAEDLINSHRVINRKELLILFRKFRNDHLELLRTLDAGLINKTNQKGSHFLKEELVIGMVGFPNVGKSSLINSICEKKKVGVDSKPGKTKNYQTIILEKGLTLCDCPGLVFPSLASSKAEMVCKGVLPISNLVGFIDPIEYLIKVCDYIQFSNYYFLPNCYENGKLWSPGPREVLQFYAASRGYTGGAGIPDENKSAKLILKDLVDGKIIHFKIPSTNIDLGGLTKKEFMEVNYKAIEGKRELIKLSDVEKTFKNIDRNDLSEISRQLKEMAGEDDIHEEQEKDEFEEMLDMMGADEMESLMEGKKVGPFKLNKTQRRTLKFAIQSGKTYEDLEQIFRGFVQKKKGNESGPGKFGVKSKGKKKRKNKHSF